VRARTPAQGWKFLLGIGLIAVNVCVFMWYTQADFLVLLANQLWGCF
jgi:hypothetical protein